MIAAVRLASLFAIYLAFSFAVSLLEVPLVRLFEQAICNRFFRAHPLPTGPISESDCKISQVQDTLSNVAGWQMFGGALPGLLTAVFYGSLANKIGRPTVLWLSAAGYTLMVLWVLIVCSFDEVFPVQVAWLSNLFLLLGGGQRIFAAMTFTMVSDQLEHKRRTKFLYLFSAGPHACRLVAPMMAFLLMSAGVSVPFYVSIGLLGVVLLSIPLLLGESRAASASTYEPLLSDHPEITDRISEDEQQDRHSVDLDEDTDESATLRSIEVQAQHRLISMTGIRIPTPSGGSTGAVWDLIRDPATRFCLAVFFVKRTAFASEHFMFQYASERFNWPLRETTVLRVAAGSGAVFVTMIFGPLLSHILTKRGVSSQKLDLNTLRGSLLVLGTAFLTAWQSTSAAMLTAVMVFCGLGEMLEPSLQGFATSLTTTDQNAQLFTTAALCDVLAELVSGPLDAFLMGVGRQPGHEMNGFIFLGSSIMFYSLLLWSGLVTAKASPATEVVDQDALET